MTPRAKVVPLDLPPGRRVLVVSDIHGDLPLFRALLREADYGGDDVLIVLGDMLERSEGGLDTLRYMMELGRTHTVHTVLGNCDNVVLGFFKAQKALSEDFYRRWFARLGERCTLVRMARLAGSPIAGPESWEAARRAIRRQFAPELAFLAGLPTILLNDDYLFVHGGVPREDRLDKLSAHQCMKNDDFLSQGHSFRRWVIVGHWPVSLYAEHVPSADPIVLPRRHIVSIDGGCTLKLDGQLNALILPARPGGDFRLVRQDGFPKVTALDPQVGSADPINVRFHHSDVEVLERGEEFTRCRHAESGRELWVLTEFLRRREDGTVWCEDSTDYRLPVSPGDTLSAVRVTSRGLLAKREGVTGWYLGKYK